MISKENLMAFLFLATLIVITGCENSYSKLQEKNTKYLLEINQTSRVFPHRVNSIGKLQDIWKVGFRSFETDAYFKRDNLNLFRVGHDDKAMSGIDFSRLLSSVDYTKIERIWLDFKNLNIDNFDDALARLQYLDNKFKVKEKIIIESGNDSGFFKKFRDKGWHISYYLPTEKILNLLKRSDARELKTLAQSLNNQANLQNLSAFSFDARLYPFVKQYLEPLIDKDIVYHTWWGPDLDKYDFADKLKRDRLFLDNRVKTILVRFKSKNHI